MTTTADLSKKLTNAHEREIEAAKQRERGYKQNEEEINRKVMDYMMEKIREDALAEHRNPVEILSATRQNERLLRHKADERLLRKHGIVID